MELEGFGERLGHSSSSSSSESEEVSCYNGRHEWLKENQFVEQNVALCQMVDQHFDGKIAAVHKTFRIRLDQIRKHLYLHEDIIGDLIFYIRTQAPSDIPWWILNRSKSQTSDIFAAALLYNIYTTPELNYQVDALYEDRTLLYRAMKLEKAFPFCALIQAKANVNFAWGGFKRSILFESMRLCERRYFHLLIKAGAKLDFPDSLGQTPTECLTFYLDHDQIKIVISNEKAKLNATQKLLTQTLSLSNSRNSNTESKDAEERIAGVITSFLWFFTFEQEDFSEPEDKKTLVSQAMFLRELLDDDPFDAWDQDG